MEKELKLKTHWKPVSTKIEIGVDYVLAKRLPEFLAETAKRAVIVTDTAVEKAYKKQLELLDAKIFAFQPGEESKTRETKAMLEELLLSHNFGRDSIVIGLGGGVVGDVSGFLAATYLRGIPHIQIPTSLLGMVDACVGGKTAVNTTYGKNTIGALHPPQEIWIDGKFLESLPDRQWVNGTVEIIKAGLVHSPALFEAMYLQHDEWKKRNLDFIMDRILESIAIKKEVVEQDPEEEKGVRRILNFGHTFGHAIEILENFQLEHGEAVAIGILVASFLSHQLGYLNQEAFAKIREIFSLYQVPLKLHKKYDVEEILRILVRDKKAVRGSPRFVLLEKIGQVVPFDGEFCSEVDFSLLEQATHWMHEHFYNPA